MSLAGRTVLVPRGGRWGRRVAALLEARGATARVVPLIETIPADDAPLHWALSRLGAGYYRWVVTSSAAAAPVLSPGKIRARVATVGPASAAALTEAGIAVDLQPDSDFSAAGLLAAWDERSRSSPGSRVLVLRSDLARADLAQGLTERGYLVEAVIAYRTRTADISAEDRRVLSSAAVDTVLVTSGSVARVLAQLDLDPRITIACLGPVTTADARQAGLRVDLTAPQSTIENLIEALDREAAGAPKR